MHRSPLTSTTPALWLALSVVVGCSDAVSPAPFSLDPGDVLAAVTTDEGTREYWVHVPPGLSATEPVPLVVALHGAGQSAEQMRGLTGFDHEADRRGFIVAYPKGRDLTWRVVGSQKDVDFLSAMVEDIASGLPVDRSRVFAAGLSQGALMTHRIGCTEESFAAIASVAASLSMLFENCTHPDPVPALFVLGTADPIFAFDEPGANAQGHWGGVGGAAFWAQRIGCTAPVVTAQVPDTASDGLTTTLWTYGGCPRGEVRLYGIEGGGHTWPGVAPAGSGALGPVTLDFDASLTILDFFLGL
ncbi:MAG: polyhydroxybutyrate depolymerase [Myxococcota bacterium]|jgi:polyhydroxybutyrate depolymerase